MKRLSSLQLFIYNAGGLLMVIGALLYATPLRPWAWLPYVSGTLGFCTMQFLAGYEGRDFVVKRLRKQQVLGALLLLVSAALLVLGTFRIIYFIRGAEWLMFFLIATVFEVYTAFRLPAALRKAGEA